MSGVNSSSADSAEPCPFCGDGIEHITSLAKSFDPPRLYHEWRHPKNDDCYIYRMRSIVESATDDPKSQEASLKRWNTRAPAQGAADCGNLATGERQNEETDSAYFHPTQGGDKGEPTAAQIDAALHAWFSVKPSGAESDAVLVRSMKAALIAAGITGTATDDMVERAARALCRYTWERQFGGKNLDAYVEIHWKGHVAAVRLALTAAPQPAGNAQRPTHSQLSELDDASNACLELAAKHGYATGHGDTVGDMIREFSAQISDIAYESASRGDLTKLAAECHRAKWEFDLNGEEQAPSKSALLELTSRAFSALHRIGDMALKLRDASSLPSTDRGSV